MGIKNLKSLLVLDESLGPGDIDESSFEELGLVVIYLKSLEEAEKHFDENKDQIGLVLSEVYNSNAVTATFLRRIIKFNSYHRVEIPIMLSNGEMDQEFMDRMKRKFSEVIKKPNSDKDYIDATNSALLKNFLKYLKFLLLKCINSPPIPLPDELSAQCSALLKRAAMRIDGESEETLSTFNHELTDIIKQLSAIGLGDSELVKDLGEIEEALLNGPNAQGISNLMDKNEKELTTEEAKMLKDGEESNIAQIGSKVIGSSLLSSADERNPEEGKVLDLNAKLENSKELVQQEVSTNAESSLDSADINICNEGMVDELDQKLIKAIHLEIDGIDEHTFNIDESEVREEVLSILRSLKDLSHVDVEKVFSGLKDIQTELKKVSSHIDIEDNIIRIVRLTKMKQAAEKLIKISGEKTSSEETTLVKGVLENLSENIKIISSDALSTIENDVLKIKSLHAEDESLDDLIRISSQISKISKAENEIIKISGSVQEKENLIKIKQGFCEELTANTSVKIGSITEHIVDEIQRIGGAKKDLPEKEESKKTQEEKNPELEKAKEVVSDKEPKEKYEMRSEYEKLKCDILDRKNKIGQTCIMLAALESDLEEVKKQLEDGADTSLKSKDGKTLIHYASAGGDLEVFDLLIEKKQKLTSFDNEGNTPLFEAIRNSHYDMAARILPETANKNFANQEGATALMLAAATGDLELFKLILKSGVNPKLKDKKHMPLTFYAKKGKNKKIMALAKKLGA